MGAEPGIVIAGVGARVVTLRVAQELCGRIASAANASGAGAGLALDMTSLQRATPRAAIYAVRSLRSLPLQRIALVRGSPVMRLIAAGVLRAARFPRFRFVHDDAEARAWLSGDPEATVRRSPGPGPALAGGVLAVAVVLFRRLRRRYRPTSR